MTLSLLLALALTADAGAPGAAQAAVPVADAGQAGSDAGALGPTNNLLRAARVQKAEGCPNLHRVTNGEAVTDGDVWDSPRTAVLAATGILEWDLGAPRPIAALRVQADNNDRYLFAGSLDGAAWYPIWVALPVDLPGVQTRTSPPLLAQARYLRLTAEGGDSMYSLGEVEAFASLADLKAEKLKRVDPPPGPPPPPAPPFDTGWLVVFGVAGAVAWYFWSEKQRSRAAPAAEAPLPGEPPKPPAV